MWGWPATRFEHMFNLHLARRHREALKTRRDMLVASVYANSNYDGKEGQEAREAMLSSINASYDDCVEILYGSGASDGQSEQREKAMKVDPLFRPVMRQIVEEGSGIGYEQDGAGQALLER